MEIKTGIVLNLYFIWIICIQYTVNVAGYQDFGTGKCFASNTNCSQFIICADDLDNNIFPGRIKTRLHDLYFPRGLTINASIFIKSSTDRSIIITRAYLTFQDDALTSTKEKYTPSKTTVPGKRVYDSTYAVYELGDIHCNGTREYVTEPTVTESAFTVSTMSYGSNITTAATIDNNTSSSNEASSTTNSPDATTAEIDDSSTESSKTTDFTTIDTSSSSTDSRNDIDTTTAVINDSSTESSKTTDFTTIDTSSSSTDSRNDIDTTTAVINDSSTESSKTTDFTTIDTSSSSTDSRSHTNSTISINVTTPHIAREDPCFFCLVQLAVEYMMADIAGVPENSTRNVIATLMSNNVTLEVSTILVLRPTHNSSKMPNLTTDIQDVTEYPMKSGKAFHLQTLFSNPLSSYKFVFKSPYAVLRIATVQIVNVGEHYKDLIAETTGRSPDDLSICSGGPDTQTIDFGYLPNKGAYNNASTTADMVELEVFLIMGAAIVGHTYPLHIDLEVDSVLTVNVTKHFNITDAIPKERIDVVTSRRSSLIMKGATGSVTLTWLVPPLSSGDYSIRLSTKWYSGPGGNGLMIAGIDLNGFGSNIQCLASSTHWRMGTYAKLLIRNIPYLSSNAANMLSFRGYVIPLPHLVEAYSSHELTAEIGYPGEGSPQLHKFYFNITDQERTTTPNRLRVYLNEDCQSITHSTEVTLILHTNYGQQYGRLFVEFPIPSGTLEQSFALCSFGNIQRGHNIAGPHYTNITKRDDGLIEKVLVDISPLTNIFLASFDGYTVNIFKMNMVVVYLDKTISTDKQALSFSARVISNNIPIWTGNLPLIKPSINSFPDFIVLTNIDKLAGVNAPNLWFYYSLNGTNYHRQALLWNGGHTYLFEFPKVIAYFYFLADPCSVICNVTAVWRPFSDYVTVVKDVNNKLLRLLPYALDQNDNTCFDLPAPEDSPSLFWLRITQLGLFGVTSKKFEVRVTGEGILCERLGQRRLQVGTSGPAHNNRCRIDSDIAFCRLKGNTTNALITQCDIQCECDTLMKCSNVHIVLQSDTNTVWRLCELTIEDV